MNEGEQPLDLASFAKVTRRLAEALHDLDKDPGNLYIQDAVIKRFELTYELSLRNLRRYLLDAVISDPDVEDMTFQGLIRIAARERLLVAGWPEWKNFKDARNRTVHTYSEPQARLVVASAKELLPQAQYLLEQLRARSNANG
jgi:nucleotidyltransferase substrate binding protein (TIGR01987 family)